MATKKVTPEELMANIDSYDASLSVEEIIKKIPRDRNKSWYQKPKKLSLMQQAIYNRMVKG